MSTSKKVTRFIGIDTNVAFKLQLDADIYTAQICQILGIGNTALPSVKKITASVSQASRDGHAKILKVSCSKGTDPNKKYRQIKLICDADNLDTAISALLGKAIKLGYGTNASDWTIDSVR